MLNLLLGQIPEAIYFALFMIYTKNLKEKRLLYIILMILEYILLIQIFPFNVWFQVLYTFISYLILKVLYKQKAQVIDIFTLIDMEEIEGHTVTDMAETTVHKRISI